LKLRHVTSEEIGIVVVAEDGMNHSWQVSFSWEGLERLEQEFHGDALRVLDAVAGRCLYELRDARARWWMGRGPRRQPVGVA
jgi:hypothetical protein